MKTQHAAVKRLLGLYVLGELGREETKLVADHVPHCQSCQAELHDLLRVAQDLRGVEVQVKLSPDFRERILNEVGKAQGKTHQDPKK